MLPLILLSERVTYLLFLKFFHISIINDLQRMDSKADIEKSLTHQMLHMGIERKE